MKKITCLLSLVLLGIFLPGLASAHHGRVGVGVYFGPGFYYPHSYYYPPPAYYPSQPIIVQQPAPVYIEQTPQQAAPPAPQVTSDWYYCARLKPITLTPKIAQNLGNAYHPYPLQHRTVDYEKNPHFFIPAFDHGWLHHSTCWAQRIGVTRIR